MRLFLLFSIISILIFGNAQAGPGHAHENLTADAASRMAVKKINQLVEKGTIHNSWKDMKPASVEKKTFAKGPEWVVVFSNKAVPDPDKQKLFVFYSLDGHYLATNYSGN